jgi:hypothetical protein
LKSIFFRFIPSTMSYFNRQIKLFNPFSLQLGVDSDRHSQIQRIIWYAESRFRQALLMFHDAPDPVQRWMQAALRQELVSFAYTSGPLNVLTVPQKFVLMVIGEASAVGLAIDIPILVRSLADSLLITTAGRPLKFHDSILAVLNNGLPANDPCALVPDYACDWWNDEAAPSADNIMSSRNVARLLKVHGTGRAISDLPVPPRAPSQPEPPCTWCRRYRDLAADAVSELHGVLEYAQAMEVSAEATLDADTRRAQGFFLLNEGVQHKEMGEIGTATVSSPKANHRGPTMIGNVNVNRRSQRVFATANAELERLQKLPLGSYKWTWGPQLTDAEAIALLAPPGNPVAPHSGYDSSLPSGGWMRFPESLVPSMPTEGSNRVVLGDHGIPLETNSGSTPDPMGSTTRRGEVQASNMEEQGAGVSTEALVPNADPGLATAQVDAVPDEIEHDQARGTGPTNTINPEDSDADSDDLAATWGESQIAEEDPPKDGDADADESSDDLAATWGESHGAEYHPPNNGDADSDVSVGAVWAPGNEADLDSDESVGELEAEWGEKHEAEDHPGNEAVVDSDESGGDLEAEWGDKDEAEDHPGNEAEVDSDESGGDLAADWGENEEAADESGRGDDAEDQSAHEANTEAGSKPHRPPLADPTTRLAEVSPTRLTLTAQRPFTGVDFDYLNPAWLEPPSDPPPYDSDEEQDSDAAMNYEDDSQGA